MGCFQVEHERYVSVESIALHEEKIHLLTTRKEVINARHINQLGSALMAQLSAGLERLRALMA
jgi:hypothetical protein